MFFIMPCGQNLFETNSFECYFQCENDVCTDLSSTTVCDETGNVNVNCVDCHNTFCNIDGDDDEYESFIASECDCGEEDVDKQVEIKRFIVLDKIPCSPKEQIFIIKVCLSISAQNIFNKRMNY